MSNTKPTLVKSKSTTNTKPKTSKKATSMTVTPTYAANTNVISFDGTATRSLATLAATIMYQAPQFANLANPNNILGLADIMHKYITGEITMTNPEQAATEPANQA